MTDTEKYNKQFIRGLPGPYKLFWDYLYHDCNHAGIWIVDMEIAQIKIGKDSPVEIDRALELFNAKEERIIVLNCGSKWFIPQFLQIQYGGVLNPSNRVHLSVIKALSVYKDNEKIKPLISPFLGAIQGAKDKDKDKDKDKGGVWGGKTKLFPIPGKSCRVKGCKLPAVYKIPAAEYDSYLCAEHMPDEVKAKYTG